MNIRPCYSALLRDTSKLNVIGGIFVRATFQSFVTAMAVLATCPVQAQTDNGALFLRLCGAAVKQADGEKLAPGESIEALLCHSYISGFLDASSLAKALKVGTPVLCLPESGVTTERAARLLVQLLHENPERRAQTGRISLYVALDKEFPCKN